MLDFIAYPIGKFLALIYNTLAFKNYGLAIIALTIVVKLVLLPSTIKQYRSTAKLTEFQPRLKEIQKQYANDPQKLNEETMKVYRENNINPAGGCLPMLIQMPILFSLYYVISQPLKYMYGMAPDVIQKLFDMIPAGSDKLANLRDLSIINYLTKNPDQLSGVSDMITQNQLLNMGFFGINLGAIPSIGVNGLFGEAANIHSWLLLLVPLLAIVTTYMSVKFSMQNSAQTSDNQAQNSMAKNMTMISPIMTGFISFTVPAGLGMYWIVSNIFQIMQQMYLNKFIIKKTVKAESTPSDEMPA